MIDIRKSLGFTLAVILFASFSGCLSSTNKSLEKIEKNTETMAGEMKYVREIESIRDSIDQTKTEIAQMNQTFSQFWLFVQNELAKLSSTAEPTEDQEDTAPTTDVSIQQNSTQPIQKPRIQIKGADCVREKPLKIAEVITDYAAYPEHQGALYSLLMIPMLRLTDVNIVHSVPEKPVRPSDFRAVLLEVVLHPTEKWFDDEKLFPRFVLQCLTQSKPNIPFVQICGLVKSWNDIWPALQFTMSEELRTQYESGEREFPRFGITQFLATVSLTPDEEKCEAGKNKFSYHIQIQPHDGDESTQSEIDLLKNASIKKLKSLNNSFGRFAETVQGAFGDNFFRAYYQNYYKEWLEAFK